MPNKVFDVTLCDHGPFGKCPHCVPCPRCHKKVDSLLLDSHLTLFCEKRDKGVEPKKPNSFNIVPVTAEMLEGMRETASILCSIIKSPEAKERLQYRG
jgi:hypothetical protein